MAAFLDRKPTEVYYKCSRLRKEKGLTCRFEWTDRRKCFLSANHEKMTWRDIARALGTSEKVVALQAGKMGLNKKRLPDLDAEIRRRVALGWFRKRIALDLGVDYSSLCKYIKKHGIECRKDEEGRREGLRKKWYYHQQCLGLAFAKRNKVV